MKNKKNLINNVWKIYGYTFFHSFILAYVIERLFWAEKGMTIQHVVYTEIIYAVIIMILEIPSGYLADIWSRKNIIVIGSICTCFEFIILIFANSFWHFALAVSVAAINSAFSSGSTNALLYDTLKVEKRESEFEKILGRINFFHCTSGAIAALLGSLVAVKLGFISNYYISLVSVIISLLFSIMLVEPKVKRVEENSTGDENNYGYIRQAYDFLKNNRNVRFVLIIGIVFGAILTYLDEFWQIYLNEIEVPVIFFGVISFINLITVSISNLLAFKLKDIFKNGKLYFYLISLFTSGLIMISYTKSLYGILFCVIVYASASIVEPLVLGYLHHSVESNYRATIESFQSLILRFATMIIGLIFGKISTQYSIFSGFRLLGFMSLIYLIYYLMNKRRYLNENQNKHLKAKKIS